MRIAIVALLLVASTTVDGLAAPRARGSRSASEPTGSPRGATNAPGATRDRVGGLGSQTTCPTTPAPVLRTGQVTAFGPGTDGELRLGADPSYRDPGDGTIVDQRTGLVWEKKSNDGSVHDLDNVYTWGLSVAPYTMNGPIVSDFLAQLNTKPCFAGQCDWRIPNLRELQTLANYERVNPATWDEFSRDCSEGCTVLTCSCTNGVPTWTSTTHRLSPRDAWAVHFTNGQPAGTVKTRRSAVRAVRGGR
ncbi:MAG: DUF1566 domain-containing protein [Alphaproteobacteria bacterium]